MAEPPVIDVKGLTAGYGDHTVLKDVNFQVEKGEVFAILGGSGCGKSTLLRHLIGLESPFSGQVVVQGVDITTCDESRFNAFLKIIGVLFQTSGLLGSMTLFENIALPILEYTTLPEKAVEKLVRLKLKQVDLEGYEDHLPSQLSGGMKKRAGLARALSLSPEILFLDEPSAGLDPITTAEIDALIQRINQSLGATIVIVTHELDSIFRIAQRVILLDREEKGIIARGHPVDLRDSHENPKVRRFFNPDLRFEKP